MQTRYALGDTVLLGGRQGVVVEGQRAVGGEFEFLTPGGSVGGSVLKAAAPAVALAGAQVWLVQEVANGEKQPRYAVMVDDAYWGLRVQPAEFTDGPLDERFIMGYRLRGRVLEDGHPVAGARVSFEVRVTTAEDGEVVFWDSEEYNELVWSEALKTWVEGARVLAPVQTDEEGNWEYIVPRGHGAAYQRETDRRDESAESRGARVERYVTRIDAVYKGHRALAGEGIVAVIEVGSAVLEVRGTPGAWLRIGPLDDRGEVYEVPESGVVRLEGLPSGEHSIVQFMRTGWGSWDSRWGCPRVVARLAGGEVTRVVMPDLEHYPLEALLVAGRVYERPGVPAEGIAIRVIDTETYEVVGTAAVTDETGYWSAEIPENGFGGDLFVHDEVWGSFPVLGSPYSDIVLGARAYSAWFDEFRPEAWRKGDYGHSNFPYVPGGLWVEAVAGEGAWETEEAAYGGWVTRGTLPKFRYVADIRELIENGPQLREYNLVDAGGVVEAGFVLGSQPFEAWESPPGQFRASGHYPEVKLLVGGKCHGNVLMHSERRVGEELPEAARFGLEFGELKPVMELRMGPQGERCELACFTGFLCPYCGGPAWRDPEPGAAEQGYCVQCAEAFGMARAMDCRSYFRSPTGCGGQRQWLRAGVPCWEDRLMRTARYHWRPDLYDESAGFVSQTAPGQPTNAPRWVSKHLDEVGDGLGLGRFDGDKVPMFTPGHDLGYFGNLPGIERDLGLAQPKLVFAAGYVVPLTFVVDIDCVLSTGETETRRVRVQAGLKGPCQERPFGDVVRVAEEAKMKAELGRAPYRGAGLYRGVADIRLVEPARASGCRFTVVADVPFLASAEGVPMWARTSTPVALQVDRPWGNPDLVCDMVGQILLTYVDEGDVVLHRRGGLAGEWDEGQKVGSDGISDYPSLQKDGRGTLVLTRQRGARRTRIDWSRDDGQRMGV